MKPTSVYVARGPENRIKIGASRDVPTRIRSLGTGVALVCSFPGDFSLEARLHELLEAWACGGEWFLPEPVVLAAVEALGGNTSSVALPEPLATLCAEIVHGDGQGGKRVAWLRCWRTHTRASRRLARMIEFGELRLDQLVSSMNGNPIVCANWASGYNRPTLAPMLRLEALYGIPVADWLHEGERAWVSGVVTRGAAAPAESAA